MSDPTPPAPQTIVVLNDVYRELGLLNGWKNATEQRLASLEQEVATSLTSLNAKVDQLLEQSAAVKGGWKAITVIATCTVAAGSLIAWVSDKWDSIRAFIFR